jgi:hypothetical protein
MDFRSVLLPLTAGPHGPQATRSRFNVTERDGIIQRAESR